MKTDINIIEENIYNLTSLWKTAGTPFLSYYKNKTLEYCHIQKSDWPNKLWFTEDISEANTAKAIEVIKKHPNLVLPYWDIYESNSFEILEKHGFTIKSEQVAMSLKLSTHFDENYKLNYKRVLNEKDAKIWSDLYPNAFGYVIGNQILLQHFTDLHYYLVYLEEQPIGTFTLFPTGNNMGIHSVGVIPEMRKKGFAEEMMRFILNAAIDSKMDYALLQASVLGKNIYNKLGFEDLFLIKNYVFKI